MHANGMAEQQGNRLTSVYTQSTDRLLGNSLFSLRFIFVRPFLQRGQRELLQVLFHVDVLCYLHPIHTCEPRGPVSFVGAANYDIRN